MDITEIIGTNRCLAETLNYLKHYHRESVFIAAGAITQTVWNYLFGNIPDYGIDDLDLIYYNSSDLSEDAEDAVIRELVHGMGHIPLRKDIKNQARVHLWYKEKFGYSISPLQSLEDAVDRFTTTANAVAVRFDHTEKLTVYAPFGLDDLFAGIIRPNKKQITEAEYLAKVNKWKSKWPELKVVGW